MYVSFKYYFQTKKVQKQEQKIFGKLSDVRK